MLSSRSVSWVPLPPSPRYIGIMDLSADSRQSLQSNRLIVKVLKNKDLAIKLLSKTTLGQLLKAVLVDGLRNCPSRLSSVSLDAGLSQPISVGCPQLKRLRSYIPKNYSETRKLLPQRCGRSGWTKLRDLENDLCSDLQVEGLARTKARRAVEVADGIAYAAIGSHRSRPCRQVDAVENVKHFGTEL
jgi:hypothetical protein